MRIGFRMEELVFQFADNNFFFSELDVSSNEILICTTFLKKSMI